MDLQEALAKRDIMTTPVLLLFLDKYGAEALGEPADGPRQAPWDADTIRLELEDDYPGTKIDEEVLQRIYAGIVMISSNAFLVEPSTFNYIAQIVGDDESPFDPDVASFPEPEECAWAISEYTLLTGDDLELMTDDVKEFISQICKRAGFAKPPGLLTNATLPWKSNDENLDTDEAQQSQVRLHVRVGAFFKLKAKTMSDQLDSLDALEGRAKDMAADIRKALERI